MASYIGGGCELLFRLHVASMRAVSACRQSVYLLYSRRNTTIRSLSTQCIPMRPHRTLRHSQAVELPIANCNYSSVVELLLRRQPTRFGLGDGIANLALLLQ